MNHASSSPADDAAVQLNIDQLKADWSKLSVIQRARSLEVIRKLGLSIRRIAKAVLGNLVQHQ